VVRASFMRRRSRVIFAVLAIIIAGALLIRLSGRSFRPLRGDTARTSEQKGSQIAPASQSRGAGPKPARRFPPPSLANLRDSASIRRILADCDASAGALFEDGMRLLDDGDADGARAKFEHLVEAFPEDKAKPLAVWAIGLSYYLAYEWHGGAHNLHQAANQFIRFRDGYSADDNLEELVHAAMLDIPVISIELMHSAPSEYERTHAAALAESTLNAFLARWPDDPRTTTARAELAEVQAFIANNR